MQWMAYATRSLAARASGLRVMTSPRGVLRASRSRPTTRVSTSRSVKMPTSRPSRLVTSTPAWRWASMVRTASWTVAVSARQIGSAGDSTAMVSFRRASLLWRGSSGGFRRSSSMVAEYSSSNSPLITSLHQPILTPRSGRGNGPGRLLAGVLQELDEPADRRGERLLAPMDEADGPHEIGNAHRHHRERAERGLVLHRVPRQDRDAGRDDDRLLDRLDVVELHDRVDAYVVLAQRAVDRLADREPGVEGDERLAVEVGRGDDAPTREPVVGMAHERHRLGAERHDRQRAVGRRIRHDADVGLALHHRLDHLVRVQALQLDACLR